ncbi:MAG: GNAT family N-acetyltransferase [Alphaproteobacteria bacterium]
MAWRAMRQEDLAQACAIADEVHAAYPEDPEVYAERLARYPGGCLVLESGGRVAGYALAHPWMRAAPPALNARLATLPARADCLHVHDIAILPRARRRGAAREALAALAALAAREDLPLLALVAIQGTRAFWQGQGFAVVDRPALAAKLAGYGTGARCMERPARR